MAVLDRSDSAPPAASPRDAFHGGDDKALLRAAAELTREFGTADARIYWADMLVSAIVGYAALAGAIGLSSPGLAVASAVVAILALYRAGSFIHELTHIHRSALPGFRLVWNLLVGIPLMIPSFLYEGVHTQHHAKTRYGTVDDPEYLPLALMKPWTLPLFVVAAMLAPIALMFRFAVLTPLSLMSPRLRTMVVERYSGLQINPAYRRKPAEGDLAQMWRWQEGAASLWAIALLALVISRVIPLRSFAIFLGVASGTMLLNQVRTLVAHLWENDGEPMSVTAQYLDSVNVPPPGSLPELWAPVGLRYHGLHHLLPSVPYHALGKAHRRLCAELDAQSPFHASSHRGLLPLVKRLAASSWRGGNPA
ncbi:MAG: fatty acid desaturase [Sphingomicrobium sp.]